MQTQPCASENTAFSMQSTPDNCVDLAVEAAAGAEEPGEDLWAEWPYCWAIDFHDECVDRFHSLHQKLSEWKLARFNKRNQREFQSQYWNQWQRDSDSEEFELRLV